MPEITLEIVKPNRPDAVQLIAELDAYLNSLYPPESNYLLDIETLMQPSIRFVMAFVDGEAVGCGALWLKDDYAEVKRMYVRQSCRGMGIGYKLLNKVETIAREAGITTLRLETGDSQPEALQLYERSGYTPCEKFGDYVHNAQNLFLEKRLDSGTIKK